MTFLSSFVRGKTFWILLFIALSCSDRRETQLQRFLLRGNEMAAKQNFSEAKRLFSEAIRLDSCFADAWNNLGTVYYKERHYPEALESYTRAIECRPDFGSAILYRANTNYELNELNAALSDLKLYSNIHGDTSVLFFSSALVYTRLENYDTAMALFDQALKRDAKNPEILVNMGIVHYLKSDFESARHVLQSALEIKDDEANAFNTLALIEAETGNPDEALRWINRALDEKPGDPWFLNNRGYFHLLKNDLSEALSDIDASISGDPYNAWAYRNKGIYYLKRGDASSSLRVLTRAMKQDSTVDRLFYYLGHTFNDLGDKSRSCEYFRKALRRHDMAVEEYRTLCIF